MVTHLCSIPPFSVLWCARIESRLTSCYSFSTFLGHVGKILGKLPSQASLERCKDSEKPAYLLDHFLTSSFCSIELIESPEKHIMFVGRLVFCMYCLVHASLRRYCALWALVWATHGLPVYRAPVYRGCPCRGPLGCPPMPRQDGIGSRAPNICGCVSLVMVDMCCGQKFKLLTLSLMSHFVTCLLFKVVGESTTIFTSATFAVSLSFDASSSDSLLSSGRAVFSSMICDVVSSSVHCSANVLRSWLWPGHLLDLLLSCSEFSGHGVALEVLVLLIQLLGVRRLARTFLLLPLCATLLAHVCSMRPVFRLHVVFSTA